MKKPNAQERLRAERYAIIEQMQTESVPITAPNLAERWGISEAGVYNYYRTWHLNGYSVPPLNGGSPQVHKAEMDNRPRQPVSTEYPAGLICEPWRPWGDGERIARVL